MLGLSFVEPVARGRVVPLKASRGVGKSLAFLVENGWWRRWDRSELRSGHGA